MEPEKQDQPKQSIHTLSNRQLSARLRKQAKQTRNPDVIVLSIVFDNTKNTATNGKVGPAIGL